MKTEEPPTFTGIILPHKLFVALNDQAEREGGMGISKVLQRAAEYYLTKQGHPAYCATEERKR